MPPHIHLDNSNTARGMSSMTLAEKEQVKIAVKLEITLKEADLKTFLKRIDEVVKQYSITIGEELVEKIEH